MNALHFIMWPDAFGCKHLKLLLMFLLHPSIFLSLPDWECIDPDSSKGQMLLLTASIMGIKSRMFYLHQRAAEALVAYYVHPFPETV